MLRQALAHERRGAAARATSTTSSRRETGDETPVAGTAASLQPCAFFSAPIAPQVGALAGNPLRVGERQGRQRPIAQPPAVAFAGPHAIQDGAGEADACVARLWG